MVGIVLGGGKGTRLGPVTKVTNKHVLPVGDKPMIAYPITTLIASGLKEIVVVCGEPFENHVKMVVEEMNFPASISFVIQKEALGMPEAINQARPLVKGQSVMVVGGDNIFGGTYRKNVEAFTKGEISFLRKVPDPKRHGVPIYNDANILIDIVEKPREYTGDRAITGPHLFDNQVFDIIKTLKPSARGELELVDLHKDYLLRNELSLVPADDYWQDVGTFESLALTSAAIINKHIQFDHDNL